MILPQRIGRFLAVDGSGHVLPDVAVDLIDGGWKPLVEFVTAALMKRQGVGSVYIRGSIPRGLAVENVSDADFIYISEINFDRHDADLEKETKIKFPFVHEIKLFRLDRAAFDKVHRPQNRPYFHMLLKTQAVLLSGDDVTKTIEPFRIGPEMVSHVFSLANEFSKVSLWLSRVPEFSDEHKAASRDARQWISKRIVRSGFEVTMNRGGRFTRDLYLCYEEFARFYPEWDGQMYQVLVNCLNGEEDVSHHAGLVTFLVNEGERLVGHRPGETAALRVGDAG